MKKSALNILVILVFVTAFVLFAGPREDQWKQVQDAMNQGLPRTAITNLEAITVAALKDRAYAEATKAIARRIVLEGNIQGNRPEEKITRMEAEIAKAPSEMKPVLTTLLAHWYWQYFQQNKWRFMERSATAVAPGKDFTTWDLPRLFAEIDRQFQAALSAERFLKATPVGAWDDLLVKGTMPDELRPTLYDFIAHEALEFYTSAEQAGARPEGSFELSADSPVLDGADAFIAWRPEIGGETNASVLRAIALYQDLLRFHQGDAAPKLAFAHVDLERLAWGWNAAFGENKNARYKTALETFVNTYADFDISALAREKHARVLQQEGDLVAARAMALRGAELFPGSPGGKLCRNIVSEIEAKTATITTERVWNAPWPKIKVHYRNVNAVYFRAIPYDWETFLDRRRNRPENLNENERREVLAKTPALEWQQALPSTTDYKQHALAMPVPDKLKPGFYFIASSHDANFEAAENVVSLTDVWVSDLALVTRQGDGVLDGFVLDAASGEPLAGVEVSVWHLDNQGNRVADPKLTTDEAGFFSMKPSRSRGYLFRARHHGHELATGDDLHGNERPPRVRPEAQTVFFTDRAIYRPGQTIQYKGICLWVEQEKDNYEVLKGESLTVVFKDVNGKEIARQKHRANDYGSFSGSFTAPRDRLMGQMYLHVEGRAQGQAQVRVEEYKRPKFEVTLDAPKTAAKLNETVTLSGHAMNYTGAAVDGGQVQYRIVREVQMPWWWGWYRGGHRGQGESQEIAHGTVRTEIDGSFKIVFVARPDANVPEKDEPTFTYQIHADVTDSAGETRSADRSIRVGYSALEATLTADDWQTEDKAVVVTVQTKTLDAEPQVAEGSLKIYALQAPEQVQRPPVEGAGYSPFNGDEDAEADLSNPNNWAQGNLAAEQGFTTPTNGEIKLSFKLPEGAYRVIVETQDRFGKRVTGKLPLQVLKPDANRLGIKVPHLLAAPEWEAQPGQQFMALWGTGYDQGRAFIEIEHRRQVLQRYWTKPGQTQQQIKVAVTEAMRGGFTLRATQVRENRGYLVSRPISVPWKNKELDIRWEHFVSKLQPGQKETWTAIISAGSTNAGGKVEKAVAEMVAGLYDESLDAFAPHYWQQRLDVFRHDYSSYSDQFGNVLRNFRVIRDGWVRPFERAEIIFRSFPGDLTQVYGRFLYRTRGVAPAFAGAQVESVVTASKMPAFDRAELALAERVHEPAPAAPPAEKGAAPKPDLGQITARKNLNETAFFFPQLHSDSNGVVRLSFTMPEALTKWRFLGFAHDRSMRSGYLEDHAVTAKDLMVQPNPPRFLREGDTIEFAAKLSNQSDKPQSGTVRLTLNQAANNESADKLLGNTKPEQNFNIPPKESRTVTWRLTVPDGCGFLTYKAVAATDSLSDGEEGMVPVLARRILVTESLPLPIRGPATKKFQFTKLLKSGDSKTLQHQNLTLQMVSNPSWYAVLALPYLMEYPHECSEQVFNRFYANTLARSIATSDPKIHRVFEQWKNTPALDSPLEKNQDLKAVMIEETPWLRQAQNESQARLNVGILFDENRLKYESDATLTKLMEMQLPDGAWPWFPGGKGNDFITLYITTGFGRLRHLGVDVNVDAAVRSLLRLDGWMTEKYDRIQKEPQPDQYVPSSIDGLYLYGRSFFLKERPIAQQHKVAVEFFLKQSRKFWLQTNSRLTQGQLAIALKRFAAGTSLNDPIPAAIMKSLKERAVTNEEMGMFWRDTELSWWWYRAPIETQALMIEAFDEVAQDAATVEECKVWLLKQKQTQDWKTTKATADAVYALLLRGKNVLASDALVEVTLDKTAVTPGAGKKTSAKAAPSVEAGTGFYEKRFAAAEIKPRLGQVTVRKVDQGVAWGSLHWQYLEDMSKVTPHEGTPLKLNKSLFVKRNTNRGQVLEPLKESAEVGDELVVRIELRTDRDMEYVHLKDQRGSGTEPVNVLSQYQYQDGLAYYESTRDTASHFFIDYLPKGVYVFEYSTRVQLRGRYQTGIAEIQCMYAPEFNSHSQSYLLTVQ